MTPTQARRTGTSTPLGQLFDHGCDCVSNLSHFACIGAALAAGPTKLTLTGQASLQFSFFVAQWQEYHLRELPHKFGELGGKRGWFGDVKKGRAAPADAVAFSNVPPRPPHNVQSPRSTTCKP